MVSQSLGQFKIESVYLQPTTKCNLDCKYCYISRESRSRFEKIADSVMDRLGQAIRSAHPIFGNNVEVVFHGGEPLLFGIENLSRIVSPLADLASVERMHFKVQTNATLITPEWCEFFKTHHFPMIGVSIDGPEDLNKHRVDWKQKPAYPMAMRGIEQLRDAGIPFSAIAVIARRSLEEEEDLDAFAAKFYNFFLELEPAILAVNIEDTTGANTRDRVDGTLSRRFWNSLIKAWRANPALRVREFDLPMSWLLHVAESGGDGSQYDSRIELLPTIAWNGDVVLFSPEFLAIDADKASQFVIGNILEDDFLTIIERGLESWYAKDFISSVELCRQQCPYFSVCRGGKPSYRYFEQGRIAGITQTNHCRSQVIDVVDTVLEAF